MSDYTTAADTLVVAAQTLSQQWLVAESAPTADSDVNYKTTHVVNDDFEYRTKYHNYSLEKLEKLEKAKPTFYEDEDGMLWATPQKSRR